MDPKEFAEQWVNKLGNLGRLGGLERFYELLLEMAEIHARKNHDYAKTDDPLSNFRQAERFGLTPFQGILLRMADKWSRIEQLSQKSNLVANESIVDSLVDNAVYSLLAICLLEETTPKKKP